MAREGCVQELRSAPPVYDRLQQTDLTCRARSMRWREPRPRHQGTVNDDEFSTSGLGAGSRCARCLVSGGPVFRRNGMTAKGLALGLLLLAGLYCGPAVAEPVGPGAGSTSEPTACERCDACKPKPADRSKLTDGTENSSKFGKCNADCAECFIRDEIPKSVPGNAVNPTTEKQ
jgi:hypothetical protein